MSEPRRPSYRYRPRDISFVLKALASGSTVRAACRSAGIDEGGWYKHLEAHPELKAKVIRVRGRIRRNVENALYLAAVTPDPNRGWTPANIQAQKVWLFNCAAEDWRELPEVQAPDGREDALARRAEELTPEQTAALRAGAAAAILGPGSDVKQ